jgi:phytol kinase
MDLYAMAKAKKALVLFFHDRSSIRQHMTMRKTRNLVVLMAWSFILLRNQIPNVESFGTPRQLRYNKRLFRIKDDDIGLLTLLKAKKSSRNQPSQETNHPTTTSTAKTAVSKTHTDDDHDTTRLSSRSWIIATALTLTIGSIIAAVAGILPGYTTILGEDTNTQSGIIQPIIQWGMLLQDVAAMILTGCLGYAFVQINTWAVVSSREIILEPRDARKIIHTCSAPLFMLFWPLFSTSPGARIFAAIVPILNAIRLYLAGTSAPDEADLATAVSRSGDVKEAVGGPFIYVIMLALSVLLFWRDSAVGIVAMSTLAAGDGMADLIGRRFGKNNKWPNSQKSVAGSLAFWLASTVTSTGLLWWMQYHGCLTLPFERVEVIATIAGITLVSAILEVIPVFGDDNYTVPLSAALLTALFLH